MNFTELDFKSKVFTPSVVSSLEAFDVENFKIKGVKGTNHEIHAMNGVAKICSPNDITEENGQVSELYPIISSLHNRFHSLLAENLTSEIFYSLPYGVSRILLSDIDQINNIKEWIDDSSSERQRNIVLEYTGKKSSSTPIFSKVNPNISGLILPLDQEINLLLEDNPHLKYIGINGDSFSHPLKFSKKLLECRVWSQHYAKFELLKSSTRDEMTSLTHKFW